MTVCTVYRYRISILVASSQKSVAGVIIDVNK